MAYNCKLRMIISTEDLSNKNRAPLTTEVILNLNRFFSPLEHKDKLQQTLTDIFSAYDESGVWPTVEKDEEKDNEETKQ